MPVEYIGYRILYDALGCGLKEQEEFGFGFLVGDDLKAEIYLGPRPRFGLWLDKSNEKYLVPGKSAMLGEFSYARDPSELDYPNTFFFEIACFKEVEVCQSLSEAFHRREQGVDDKLLDIAEESEEGLKRTTELVAGVVGLRFHRQFVLEPINEHPIVLILDHKDDSVSRQYGKVMELLNEITLRQEGLAAISNLLPLVGSAKPSARDNGAKVFKWLLRAWSQRDSVTTFVASFIVFEIILQQYRGIGQELHMARAEAIERLIKGHSDDQRDTLLNYFNSLRESWSPSLQSRFEAMAREAGEDGLTDWEADARAFKKFNRIRNDLLHRGKDDVELHVDLGEETQELEDFVERYICFALFNNMDVYRSGWGRRGRESGGDK